MTTKVVEITSREEYENFKKNRRAVIFYGAKWCDACTYIHNLYERIANRYHKHVKLAYVDIDVCELDFSAVPIFVSLRKGQQLNSMEGADKKGLKQLIKEVIQAE